jgi:hypothetical protein
MSREDRCGDTLRFICLSSVPVATVHTGNGMHGLCLCYSSSLHPVRVSELEIPTFYLAILLKKDSLGLVLYCSQKGGNATDTQGY